MYNIFIRINNHGLFTICNLCNIIIKWQAVRTMKDAFSSRVNPVGRAWTRCKPKTKKWYSQEFRVNFH